MAHPPHPSGDPVEHELGREARRELELERVRVSKEEPHIRACDRERRCRGLVADLDEAGWIRKQHRQRECCGDRSSDSEESEALEAWGGDDSRDDRDQGPLLAGQREAQHHAGSNAALSGGENDGANGQRSREHLLRVPEPDRRRRGGIRDRQNRDDRGNPIRLRSSPELTGEPNTHRRCRRKTHDRAGAVLPELAEACCVCERHKRRTHQDRNTSHEGLRTEAREKLAVRYRGDPWPCVARVVAETAERVDNGRAESEQRDKQPE